ncbi:MAG: class I SAM-dependent methyltransferase [Methanobacteriota archaeon]|nr:MAG: class I SAM-dependent methyltransferase [Euryarchaeota archaeon]
MERVYRTVPLHRIPWNIETPPDALVGLVDRGIVPPGRAIDLGCGVGNYAIYLAGRGFDMTGVDVSPTAITIARQNAKRKGVAVHFLVADILGDMRQVQGTFDFAYDWEVLHHIFPDQRRKYVENVHRVLNPGSKYLSLSFSEQDPQFGGSGKYRKTALNTVLYFSSEAELRDLFSPLFTIVELKSVTMEGKFGPHVANYVFMEKRQGDPESP